MLKNGRWVGKMDKHWLQTNLVIRTLKYRSKYQNSRPVELQTKCYLARMTAPQNPQRNVSSEANSTPRVLVSGWEGFHQLPFCSSIFWTELWTSFKFKCWKTLELLFTTRENIWKVETNKFGFQQFYTSYVSWFSCCLLLALSGDTFEENVTFEQVKWQKTWTQHDTTPSECTPMSALMSSNISNQSHMVSFRKFILNTIQNIKLQ